MDGCGRGEGAGAWLFREGVRNLLNPFRAKFRKQNRMRSCLHSVVKWCRSSQYEDVTCDALEPLTSKFQKTEPNAQLSSFGCQMVKIAYYNRMKTTADSVLLSFGCVEGFESFAPPRWIPLRV